MKYYMDDPHNDKYEVEIPRNIVNNIIKDYMMKTYYWVVGIGGIMIGFLLGLLAK